MLFSWIVRHQWAIPFRFVSRVFQTSSFTVRPLYSRFLWVSERGDHASCGKVSFLRFNSELFYFSANSNIAIQILTTRNEQL